MSDTLPGLRGVGGGRGQRCRSIDTCHCQVSQHLLCFAPLNTEHDDTACFRLQFLLRGLLSDAFIKSDLTASKIYMTNGTDVEMVVA